MSRVFAWLEVTMLCCLCVIGGGCIRPDRNWERVWINSWDEIYNYGRFVESGEILRVEGVTQGTLEHKEELCIAGVYGGLY